MRRISAIVLTQTELYMQGILKVLESAGFIDVIGKCHDLCELSESDLSREPDVLIAYLDILKCSGIDSIEAIKEKAPNMRIIVIAKSSEFCDLVFALKIGASAYLHKEVSAEDLVSAISLVLHGELVLSDHVAKEAIGKIVVESNDGYKHAIFSDVLTAREIEILQLAKKGFTKSQIAGSLVISENTVKVHMHHVMEKLHEHTRLGAIFRLDA